MRCIEALIVESLIGMLAVTTAVAYADELTQSIMENGLKFHHGVMLAKKTKWSSEEPTPPQKARRPLPDRPVISWCCTHA